MSLLSVYCQAISSLPGTIAVLSDCPAYRQKVSRRKALVGAKCFFKSIRSEMWGMKLNQYYLLCCCLFLLSACNSLQEIATSLDAKQSVEMVVALNRAGVQASREQVGSGRSVTYRVLVSPVESSKALEVLHEYGLPRTIDDSLEEITRPRGFVPNTPQLAQLRLDHALELRVERALLSLPGVVEARVVVQSDTKTNVLGSTSSERGVSVVIRFISSEARSLVPNIDVQELVAQAVPGVSSENVEIRSITAQVPQGVIAGSSLVQLKPFSFRVPVAERGTAGIQILVMFGAFCIAGLFIGIGWSSRINARRRRRLRTALSNEGGRSMFLEASLQENAQTKASLPQIKDTGS